MRMIRTDGRNACPGMINAEKLLYVGTDGLNVGAYDTAAGTDTILLGRYSTEARARRVLDMLHEWMCLGGGTQYDKFGSFQMPEDSSELDKEEEQCRTE